jgi:hypothetical protein
MDVTTRNSLIDVDGLCRYLNADLEEGKTAKFIDRPENGMGFCCWPSLTFCMHEGKLYQLYTIGGIVGYDSRRPANEDPNKIWVKVREI